MGEGAAILALGGPDKKSAPLRVFMMAAALVIAAFLGAALGLVWQSSGADEDEQAQDVLTVEEPTT